MKNKPVAPPPICPSCRGRRRSSHRNWTQQRRSSWRSLKCTFHPCVRVCNSLQLVAPAAAWHAPHGTCVPLHAPRWCTLFYGSAPYILCYAAAGHWLQLFALTTALQLHPLSHVFDLSNEPGRLTALIVSLRLCSTDALTVSGRATDTNQWLLHTTSVLHSKYCRLQHRATAVTCC